MKSRYRNEMDLIKKSGLFDEDWYLSAYPDVVALGMDPVEHYLRFGVHMLRNPGPCLDTEFYLRVHKDVATAEMNPLTHYIRYGRAEGRRALPNQAPVNTTLPQVVSPSAPKKLPLTALVITWDIGHNPLGRSYMLADVLDRVVRNVVIAGFQFPRYGNDVWEPVREGRLPVIRLPGKNFPEFLESMERISQRFHPDIVFACKPRLPSIQLGALIKEKFGCPLVLDIDDHELSFFKGASEVDLCGLRDMPDGSATDAVEPYGEIWTRFAQTMRRYADEIIVSNGALQSVFKGTIIPHVRDEKIFDPSLYDRTRSKSKYGVPEDSKVLLFFGTPRHHKGINVLAKAVGDIDDPSCILVVVGTSTDRSVTSNLNKLSRNKVIFIPNQPFASIPEIVAMADVVCLPQDVSSPISKFQLPAKAIDAIAMGVPLLVSPTPPLMQLVNDGVAKVFDPGSLAGVLREVMNDPTARHEWSITSRPRYLAKYSYASAAKTLRELVSRAVGHVNVETIGELRELIAHQRRLLGIIHDKVPETAQSGVDIVVFWKQNDTGLYGRRSDMVIRYLASRKDVRKVVVFDAPISRSTLLNYRDRSEEVTQYRKIYTKTYEQVFGVMDTPKISFNTFAYLPGSYRPQSGDSSHAVGELIYMEFVSSALQRENVRPASSIFWFYPEIHAANSLIDHFSPRRVVVDVVDDHRAWPGVSEERCKRLTEYYRLLLTRSDMTFANCDTVACAMRTFDPSIRMVPNGCDGDPPRAEPVNNPAFDEFVSFEGKTIGFIGNLEKKIDVELIEKVASAFPESQVVLLGSTHSNPRVRELRQVSNIRMPGVVPYAEIGAWVSHFDVGLIPHLDMELTRSMNPLKLYVYLAWGVPVVSTDIYNIERGTQFVRVASTHEEFIEAVDEMLAVGKKGLPGMRDFVEANSWKTRLESHVDELLS